MKTKRLIFWFAKALVAAAIIFWLLRKIDFSRVQSAIRGANRTDILFGTLLIWLTIAIAGWRWQRWLALFAIHIPLRSLICITQIGQFFLIFLPGPTGDDLTRMLYISRLAKGRIAEACTTVLLDRCMGLSSVLVLALFCMPWQWELLSSSNQTYWFAVAILSAGLGVFIFGAAFFVAGHPTHRWFERRLRSLPAHSTRDEAARIWGILCANKRCVAQLFCAAMATQLLLCVAFYLAGSAVEIKLPLRFWLSFVPIVLAANAIPITIAGFGIREYLLVLFLGVLAKVDQEHALAASFVAIVMILAVCMLGGILYLFYRPKRETPIASTLDPPAL
jgi:uncharacterized protein (TIRG00374 family)